MLVKHVMYSGSLGYLILMLGIFIALSGLGVLFQYKNRNAIYMFLTFALLPLTIGILTSLMAMRDISANLAIDPSFYTGMEENVHGMKSSPIILGLIMSFPGILFGGIGFLRNKRYSRNHSKVETFNINFPLFFKRLLAFLIDYVIIALLFGFIQPFILGSLPNRGILFIEIVLYFTIFEMSPIQATPGKSVFKLIVSDTGNNRLGLVKACSRSAMKWLSFFTVVGAILPLFSERNQALHDLMSKTIVSAK